MEIRRRRRKPHGLGEDEEMPKKQPPEKPEDWSVEWPDGSWLTWNEETGTWDKQEAPKGRAKASQPKPTARVAKSAASPKKTTAKGAKTPPKPKASPKTPVAKVESREVATTTPSPTPAPEGSPTGWRPQAERSSAVVPVERSTQIRRDRSVSVPPRAQTVSPQGDRWPVSAIAAGVVAGVAAGYLLTFLVA